MKAATVVSLALCLFGFGVATLSCGVTYVNERPEQYRDCKFPIDGGCSCTSALTVDDPGDCRADQVIGMFGTCCAAEHWPDDGSCVCTGFSCDERGDGSCACGNSERITSASCEPRGRTCCLRPSSSTCICSFDACHLGDTEVDTCDLTQFTCAFLNAKTGDDTRGVDTAQCSRGAVQ